jgi:hypothetical protein
VTPLVAHAAGTDETVSLVLLFAAIWTAWVGWSRLRGRGFERLPRWGGYAALVVAGAFAVSATFLPRQLLPTPAPVSAAPRPASTATIGFVEPRDGARTSADQMTVRLRLDGASLTSATTTSIQPDAGHVHLSVDGAIVSMSGNVLQVIDLRTLAPGEHTLTAEFVAADHLSFNPPVTAEITFVKEAAS